MFKNIHRGSSPKILSTRLMSAMGLILGVAGASAGAVTIDMNFIEPGQSIPMISMFTGKNAGEKPSYAPEKGLQNLFQAAADLWESALPEDYALTVNVAWYPWTSDTAAITFNSFDPANSARARVSTIAFNNKLGQTWFFDSTPGLAEEFKSGFTATSKDLGEGDINIGRQYKGGQGVDLFTIAVHELGHSLGLTGDLSGFGGVYPSGKIIIGSELPFADTVLPLSNAGGSYQYGHLNLPTALMYPYYTPGTRVLPSEADILAVAQVAGYSQVNLNPSIPEPATLMCLMGLTVTLLGRARRVSTSV